MIIKAMSSNPPGSTPTQNTLKKPSILDEEMKALIEKLSEQVTAESDSSNRKNALSVVFNQFGASQKEKAKAQALIEYMKSGFNEDSIKNYSEGHVVKNHRAQVMKEAFEKKVLPAQIPNKNAKGEVVLKENDMASREMEEYRILTADKIIEDIIIDIVRQPFRNKMLDPSSDEEEW